VQVVIRGLKNIIKLFKYLQVLLPGLNLLLVFNNVINVKLLASLRSSLRDGPSLRYGALHSSLSLLAILAWGIKLILKRIANKATEACLEANISV